MKVQMIQLKNRAIPQLKKTFFCSEEVCIRSYQRYSSLQKHLDFQSFMPRLVFYIFTWKSLMNHAQYNSWRCCSRLRRRPLLVLNTVPQPPQEEASICHLATTRPPLRRSHLKAHQQQQSANQSPRPLTHSMIICALEKSVPFVLCYSGLRKKRVKKHDATTCGRQIKVYLHFYKT